MLIKDMLTLTLWKKLIMAKLNIEQQALSGQLIVKEH